MYSVVQKKRKTHIRSCRSCCVRKENKKKKYKRNTSCVGWWSVSSFLAHTTWLFYDSSSCLWNSIFKKHTHTGTVVQQVKGKFETSTLRPLPIGVLNYLLRTTVRCCCCRLFCPLTLWTFLKAAFFFAVAVAQKGTRGDIWLDLLEERVCVCLCVCETSREKNSTVQITRDRAKL